MPTIAAPSTRPHWRKLADLFAADERRGLGTLLALVMVSMVLETLGAGLVLPSLAMLSSNSLPSHGLGMGLLTRMFATSSRERLIVSGMLALAAIYLVKNLLLAMLAWRQSRFTHELYAHLSQRLFTLYLSQPYTFHLQRNTAQLINNIRGEVLVFTAEFVAPALTIVAEGIVLVALAVLLLVLDPAETLAVGIFIAGASWGFHAFTRRYTDLWGANRQYHEDRFAQELHEGLGAAKEIILFGRAPEFRARFGLHSTLHAVAAQRHDTLKQMPRLALETLAVIALGFLTISMVLRGRPSSDILPTLGLFGAVAFRVLPSANRILSALQSIRFAAPSVARLHEEFTSLTPPSTPARGALRAFERTVELRDVTFGYPGAAGNALLHVSASFDRGEAIGVVGSSGAGKSTFIDVLLGLLTPAAGHVLLDGRDIHDDLRNWQDQIGYVPQVIYLTDDTLRRNIAFGREDCDIDDDAVRRAVCAAQLQSFVAALPAGLDTVTGERGVRISGGERQRLGIARALYHNPAVLILDEATSALDTGTEREVMRTVRHLRGEKSLVIVSHRLSTVEGCDRVFRLDAGDLREIDVAALAASMAES